MKNNFRKILLVFLVHCSAFPLIAQVWPGDVNNNGVVNNVDWIYLSNIFEEAGPPRPIMEMGIDWEEKTITTEWGTDFSGTTTDYVFADCNGDGIITGDDLEAIASNFSLEHGTVTEDFAIEGNEGIDPQLFLGNEPLSPFPQGGVLFLEIFLGTEGIPVENFSGITFDLEFDTDIIADIFFVASDEPTAGWGQYGLMNIESTQFFDQGKISYAFSTIGNEDIVSAQGLLGQFFIVIEDDVVGWQDQEVETSIMLENVILFGNELEVGPVVNDTVDLTVVVDPLSTDDFLNSNAVEVFPNPAVDFIYLKTNYNINQIEIFNTLGQKIKSINGNTTSLQKVDLSSSTPGIHLFKISTDEGILTKKIMVE